MPGSSLDVLEHPRRAASRCGSADRYARWRGRPCTGPRRRGRRRSASRRSRRKSDADGRSSAVCSQLVQVCAACGQDRETDRRLVPTVQTVPCPQFDATRRNRPARLNVGESGGGVQAVQQPDGHDVAYADAAAVQTLSDGNDGCRQPAIHMRPPGGWLRWSGGIRRIRLWRSRHPPNSTAKNQKYLRLRRFIKEFAKPRIWQAPDDRRVWRLDGDGISHRRSG